MGLLPEAAPLAQLTLGATYAELIHVRMQGRYWKQQEYAIPGYADALSRVGAASLGLRLCGRPHRPEWALALCTGPEVGELRSRGLGSDFRTREQPKDVWWGWTGSVGLEVPIAPPLFVETTLEGGLALIRPDIGFHDQGAWVRVSQPDRGFGSLILALGAHLP